MATSQVLVTTLHNGRLYVGEAIFGVGEQLVMVLCSTNRTGRVPPAPAPICWKANYMPWSGYSKMRQKCAPWKLENAAGQYFLTDDGTVYEKAGPQWCQGTSSLRLAGRIRHKLRSFLLLYYAFLEPKKKKKLLADLTLLTPFVPTLPGEVY